MPVVTPMAKARKRTTVSGEGCKRFRMRGKRYGEARADEFGCSTLVGGMAVIEGQRQGGLKNVNFYFIFIVID